MNFKNYSADGFSEMIEKAFYIMQEGNFVRPAVNSILRQTACDFMLDEFIGMGKSEIDLALSERADDIQADWEAFANKAGLSDPASIAAGWEMIFANDFLFLPDAGKFY